MSESLYQPRAKVASGDKVTCYESNRGIYSAVYDPNGNALTYGDIVDLINDLSEENLQFRNDPNHPHPSTKP